MNIRKCYIENFGKFHEYNHEFTEGLNVINEKNGWGKSTLATFIKAMFFGFDSTNKRAVSENERKKYYPWQGGKFGGNLEFEIDGKVYEIERFFGLKDKEDTFKLYNKTTNCESNDYSKNIGEEIFKIDRQAYERSTYIPQQDIAVEINDSLSAKLSNILESENDINSSEAAINRITTIMKEYKKIGNKGRINELETKINNKKRELEYAEKNEELINERNKKIEKIKSEIKILEEEKNKNQEKINLSIEQEKNKIKKERYEELCKIVKQDEEELEKLKKYFSNKTPDETEVKRYEEITYQLDNLLARLDETVIENKDRERYEKIKDKFTGKEISEEIINNYYSEYNEVKKLENELKILNEKLTVQEEMEKIEEERIEAEKKKQNNNKIIISILIIIIGIILGTVVLNYLYAISVLGLIILLLPKKKENTKTRENTSKNEILQKIQELDLKKSNLNQRVIDFVNMFNDGQEWSYIAEEYKIYEKISSIKNEYKEFKNLSELINNTEKKTLEYKNNIDELVDEISNKLEHYFNMALNKNNIIEFNAICKKIIFEIKNKKIDFGNLVLKIEADKKSKANYEGENNLQEIELSLKNNIENKEELIKINNEISKNINDLVNQKSYDENEMNRLINTQVTPQEIEDEIANLEQELVELSYKYNILDKTQKYLAKAKEEFSSHYLKGMTDGFKKYINLINDDDLNTNIDVKLNVKVQEFGEKKEIEYLSVGYRDLIGICMRLALVDALFENEKPFVILDDPFVNLDKDKIERARELVAGLSEKYQVIYFVCHESRE